MEKTPRGTAVGVDDPYEFAGVCDHLTDDGRCRYAVDHFAHDPAFARERAREAYACPVVDPDSNTDSAGHDWAACPHFRSRSDGRECVRCGLEERLDAHSSERPLLEEHHLSYAGGLEAASAGASEPDGERPSHEITVSLCRWCHAKVHTSWARLTDDVSPDPEAIAALETRRGKELEETTFESAAERYERRRDG
ncbi:DUF7097 family protein [Natronobiforma cellulositropha]|uniref:DUF7097 family protein n=1 Tax=Natronobiforma cellulositropha TaxID=1679076 RepID=UPI0021D5C4E5|nr:hypothetical protein [Natronobiforma cellulositropha]